MTLIAMRSTQRIHNPEPDGLGVVARSASRRFQRRTAGRPGMRRRRFVGPLVLLATAVVACASVPDDGPGSTPADTEATTVFVGRIVTLGEPL